MSGPRPSSSSRLPRNPSHPSSQSLILSDETTRQDTEDPLHGYLHPHNTEESLPDDGDNEDEHLKNDLEQRRILPWWKRPSALWIFIMIPFIFATTSLTTAPRIELITQLVCRTLRPERSANNSLMGTCSSDPVVQAVTAKFLAVMAIVSGGMSSLTAAWWGSRSDRKGRVSTMRICIFGVLVTDVAFLLVHKFLEKLPGGYWFLLVGPIVDGLLGGLGAASANIHAYVADCTEPEKRSRIFSLYLGLLYIGLAVGSTLGSLLIRNTHEVISVFYLSTAMHILYTFILWFILPESLFPRQLVRAKQNYMQFKEGSARFSARTLVGFLAPLRVFIPTRKAGNNSSNRSLDWSLTLLGGAYGFSTLITGSYSYKFQYASWQFGWGSETLGYWMSIVGIARALFLTFILPTVIALLKPERKAPEPSQRPHPAGIALPQSRVHDALIDDESTPLLSSEISSNDLKHDHKRTATALDLNIARISLLVEVTSYILIAVTATGPLFTLWSVLGSFGTGFLPAVQSLALAIYASRGGTESGSLFGAMSVINSLGGSLISPALFGFTFAETVDKFPQAIFVVCAVAVACSLVFVSLVRLPKEGPTAYDAGLDGDVNEGRLHVGRRR